MFVCGPQGYQSRRRGETATQNVRGSYYPQEVEKGSACMLQIFPTRYLVQVTKFNPMRDKAGSEYGRNELKPHSYSPTCGMCICRASSTYEGRG